MQWLNSIVDDLLKRNPDGEIVVSSGVSPSGTYHIGTLREVLTAEAIAWEVRRRNRQAKHLHIVDDLDVFRKVPVGIPESFKEYLGKPLCDVPSPDGVSESYADYYVKDLFVAVEKLHLSLEVIRANERYRDGFFVGAIEKAYAHKDKIQQILEEISGHAVDENWSPMQVMEDGYLKNRRVTAIDEVNKSLTFIDKDDEQRSINYDKGEVKLNWRIDWPARWWLLKVDAEPFGRDHATKGGSYDTGAAIVARVFDAQAPLPMPYNFINRTGDTKKMSKSAGDVITASELLEVLPPEVVWYFVLRYAPDKQLFFDTGATLMRLVDEFSELLTKDDKSEHEQQLIALCLHGVDKPTVSRIPFSHLVASYQAALRDPNKTLDIIARTEYSSVVSEDHETIVAELRFIDAWLDKHAPEDVKFTLAENVNPSDFNEAQKQYLSKLADLIEKAPPDADGTWFHQTTYSLKDEIDLPPKEMFTTLYKALINKDSGPRAGWFMSLLPRDWLIKRLRLEA
jgi:lysyl-tRNA synthetase class 1